MRLIDKVMAAPQHWLGKDQKGRIHQLPAPGCRAPDLQRCSLRYIIDRSASYQCGDLLRREPDLLQPESPLLRAPAEHFWMEWFEEEFADGQDGSPNSRLAVLVNGDPAGRRGQLSFFHDDGAEGVGMSPLVVHYDLDHRASVPVGSSDRFRLVHRDLPHVDRLLQHAVVTFDGSWNEALQAVGNAERRQFLSERASVIWIALPVMFAFSALLNDGSVLDQRTSDLQRLNKARQQTGRRPLLDHVEVGMRLGAVRAAARGFSAQGRRVPPRLHFVRGHQVNRGGKVFWRSPHFRGDLERPILSRTVTVRKG